VISFFRKVQWWLQRRRKEDELREELEFHVAEEASERQGQGLSTDEARWAASRDLGNRTLLRENVRALWSWRLVDQLSQDLRYSFRTLQKAPAFTATAVLTLALGIGANTAIFSIVDGVLLNPISYADPDRLVALYGTSRSANETKTSVSYPNLLDWQRDNQTFEALAGWRSGAFSLTGDGYPELVRGQQVSANIVSVLQVQPLLGRMFRAEEDRLGAEPVVVVGEGFWMRRFGADPNIIGRSITLNGKAHTVVGVLPQSVRILNSGAAPFNDVFTPLGQYDFELFRNRGVNDGTQGVGRLKADVTLTAARADMDLVAKHLEAAYPEDNNGVGINVRALKDDLIGDVRPIVFMLVVAVGLVLVIACANVANLLLARATTRTHEFALRTALGADRRRIIRQLLTESSLLSMVGGAIGLMIARPGMQSILNVFPSALPASAQVVINARVLAASFGLAVLTGILFGLIPALSATRTAPHDALKIRGTGAHPARRAAQNLFVVTEVALTLALLVVTGLMVRSLTSLLSANPGFNPRDVLTFYTRLSTEHASSPAKVRAALVAIEERLAVLPGVESTSVDIGALPFSGGVTGLSFWRADKPKPVDVKDLPVALFYAVGTDYFSTMGIPLRRGRSFTVHDDARGRPVMIVDEELARTVFHNEDPLGKSIRIGAFGQEIEIIGVVGHVKHHGLIADDTAAIRGQCYVPHMQLDDQIAPLAAGGVAVMIKSAVSTESLLTSIRRELAAFDAGQAIVDARRMDDVVTGSLASRRFSLLVLAMFAAIAFVLAAVGIYGVVTHLVGQRTREFGIRLALGARAGDVLGGVLGYGLRLALAGTVIGVACGLGLSQLLRNLLFGVSPHDPTTIAFVTVLLLGVTLGATYLPARRATKVDPMVALRCE
jgi:predicted permease